MRTPRPSRSFRAAALVVLAAAGGCAPAQGLQEIPAGGIAARRAPGPRGQVGSVLAGVDVLLQDSLPLVRGKRVGLVTNHTGVSVRYSATGAPDTVASTVDALFAHPEVQLVALFSPEHGLSGREEAGERVASGAHAGTGLPIYSLYTGTLRPLPHMLAGVDILLFDIQDVGARYYTYVSTMALAMEAAGQAGIPFVVLDRPNPLGGDLVQGNVLEPEHASFIGIRPVPMRHGMTPGELARLFQGAFGVRADLHVIPLRGWRRAIWYDQTGLPWTPPSPNMPSLESATHYPGTCLFEGTNLSVGRGTDRPFQWIGAPWLDGPALAERLNAYRLPGVRFEAATFTPERPGDGKWDGETVHGVRFFVTDRSVYDPPRAAVAALVEARRMSGSRWQWLGAHFDQLAGTEQLRRMIEEGGTLEEVTASWDGALATFQELRAPYLIYP